MRLSNNLCRCIEDGLENVALAERELEVGSATYAVLLATRQVVRDAMADGYISRGERHDIDTHMAVVEAGLLQALALDVEDHGLGRTLAGRLDGMSRKGHGSAANAPAECGLSR